MLWSRAKTILIVAFLLINIFLLSYMFGGNYSDNTRAMLDLTAVLSESGINLRVDHMPQGLKNLHVPELSPLVIDENLANKLMKAPVATETGFTNQDATCRLESKDGLFFYRNEAPSESGFHHVKQSNAVSKIQPYLDKLGVGNLTYAVSVSQIGEDTVVEYAYRIGDYKLFGSRFSVTVTKQGIKQIKGFLGTVDGDSGFSYQLSQLRTVLFSLAQNNLKDMEITHIELGYHLINYRDALVSQAIPVYRLRTSRGEYILDARDGVEYTERVISGDLEEGSHEEVFVD